jgi:ABC-type multidrug transport system ATPase subunit/ABC-type multidrug transport system permease subunit
VRAEVFYWYCGCTLNVLLPELQVTSKKDQEQYWYDQGRPYQYVPVAELANAFRDFRVGKELDEQLSTPFDKSRSHPAALVNTKYALSSWNILKACVEREALLIKRNRFLYIFRTCQVAFVALLASTLFFRTRLHPTTEVYGTLYLSSLFFALVHMMFNGFSEMSITVARLPVLYKQRDNLFYPGWAFSVPSWILRLPYSIAESLIWSCIVYYIIGLAPEAGRFFRYMLLLFLMHQMAIGLFRLIGALGRTMVVANTFGSFALLVAFVLGGFILARQSIHPWWIWGYWISPLSYAQNAIAVNEFLAPRWRKISPITGRPLYLSILESRGIFTRGYWYWIGIGALIGYIIIFNVLATLALQYLNPIGKSQATVAEDTVKEKVEGRSMSSKRKSMSVLDGHSARNDLSARNGHPVEGMQMQELSRVPQDGVQQDGVPSETAVDIANLKKGSPGQKGMILPFEPLALTFHDVSYYVDMPSNMKGEGVTSDKLQLLRNVSGAFRPGVLTALMGVSGAGKTTLMDVLAGRKTGGYIEGDIKVSGYPKVQDTFARVAGYVEQTDIHSPQVTVHESLTYSSWLRLPKDVDKETRETFVEEVMELVELNPLRDSLVGLPGSTGLSTEQRKRLTIAVELVANPSIIFMDEPTSGLDARAAAIVMRTVRNTVDTGRTVVCTIHQPSIDIFEAFDELLLLKRGGQTIYAGPLGPQSRDLVEYFQAMEGTPPIHEGYNPATWMLEISTPGAELRSGKDFADHYRTSDLFRRNEEMIKALSVPKPGSHDLKFPTKFSRSAWIQYRACLWKQKLTYWRSPYYNAVRFFFTVICALIFGSVFWNLGSKR